MDTVPPGTRISAFEDGRNRFITRSEIRLWVINRLPLEKSIGIVTLAKSAITPAQAPVAFTTCSASMVNSSPVSMFNKRVAWIRWLPLSKPTTFVKQCNMDPRCWACKIFSIESLNGSMEASSAIKAAINFSESTGSISLAS